jgi:hypothetical protein
VLSLVPANPLGSPLSDFFRPSALNLFALKALAYEDLGLLD